MTEEAADQNGKPTNDGEAGARLSQRLSAVAEVAIHTLRTALFLASIMALLHMSGFIEGLDALMLKAATSLGADQFDDRDQPPVTALVFTIGERLFAEHFGARTPIDREKFQKLLETIDEAYDFKVLAVDYDLSPNRDDKKGQESLDAYLQKQVKEGQRIVLLKHFSDRDDEGQKLLDESLQAQVKEGQRIVLLKHFPDDKALEQEKARWECQMGASGISFGDGNLLKHGLIESVVKYEWCADRFAAVVCAEVARSNPKTECPHIDPCVHHSQARVEVQQDTAQEIGIDGRTKENGAIISRHTKPINFRGAMAQVKECPLEDLKQESVESCKKHLKGKEPLDVVFVGGRYGVDDAFGTPVDKKRKAGVILHAYIYSSLLNPLQESHFKAWWFDIRIGFLFGMIFHWIWTRYHDKKSGPSARLGWATANVLLLIGVMWWLVLKMPDWVAGGFWINPAPIMMGLFIDSHIAAAVTAHNQHKHKEFSLNKLWNKLKEKLEACKTCAKKFSTAKLKAFVFWLVVIGALVGIFTH